MPPAALPNVQEQGETPDSMALAKAIYTKVGIQLSRKSLQLLQFARQCQSPRGAGCGQRLHVIEVLTCLRQE